MKLMIMKILMNYNKNIIDLIRESHKFQYSEIGEANNEKINLNIILQKINGLLYLLF